jgi:anti-sigma B factor antagonist
VELTVTHWSQGDVDIVAVNGEVDVYTAPALRERLNGLISTGRCRLVIDLHGVQFLDSTGLGVLVGALKKARSLGGELTLVCSQERILKVFRITGLTSVFPIHATLDEAVADSERADGEPADEAVADDEQAGSVAAGDRGVGPAPDGSITSQEPG